MAGLQIQLVDSGYFKIIRDDGYGFTSKVSHIAIGDAAGVGYTPSKTRTGLVNERKRVPLAIGSKVDGQQMHIEAYFDAFTESFPVREVAGFLETGEMLFVYSAPSPNDIIAYAAPNTQLPFAFDLGLERLPQGALTVQVSNIQGDYLWAGQMMALMAHDRFLDLQWLNQLYTDNPIVVN